MRDLSIVIPARNERFLRETVADALAHSEADTEVVAVLDGAWADPPVPQHPRLRVLYLPESVGQRAATNLGARLASGKYLMKADAHCAFEQGFDRKLVEAMERVGPEVTLVPVMRNLWAFDWKCYHCGKRMYQGPTPKVCPDCGRTDKLRRKLVWQGKPKPRSTSYCFDSEPHFQYFGDYCQREVYRRDLETSGLTETMGLQGSCFVAAASRYWELDLSGESLGNWGNQGIEVACKSWLSGGKVLVCHDTWYAHMFRTQGGDFGFPYALGGREVSRTKARVRDLFWRREWARQVHPVSWLVERFWPVPGWTTEALAALKEA